MKITKRQLRRIIREEKANIIAQRNNRRSPLTEGLSDISDGISAFMSLLQGEPEKFEAWVESSPKVKSALEYMFAPHKDPRYKEWKEKQDQAAAADEG